MVVSISKLRSGISEEFLSSQICASAISHHSRGEAERGEGGNVGREVEVEEGIIFVRAFLRISDRGENSHGVHSP